MIITLKPPAQTPTLGRASSSPRALGHERSTTQPPREPLLGRPASAAVDAHRAAAASRGVASVVAPASPPARRRAGARRSTCAASPSERGRPVFHAGPCAVESEAQIDAHRGARRAAAGAQFLRGGAFKPRSSPYAFQGHGETRCAGCAARPTRNGLRVVTEALGEADVALVAEYADLVQVGSRNMQNFALLKAIGRAGRPVLLKRAMSATVEEWLLAGEYLLEHGAAGRDLLRARHPRLRPARATCSTSGRSRCSPTSTTSRWWSTRRTPRGAATWCCRSRARPRRGRRGRDDRDPRRPGARSERRPPGPAARTGPSTG
jgi:3-deoxy-7-phosphoheptulonate synthase